MSGTRGQATVEVFAFLPLIGLVALIAMAFIAAHSASEQAGEAAEAGALVVLQSGGDAQAAARRALPERLRRRATITVDGTRVSVRVRPRVPIPGLSDRLAGTAHADAGPHS